MQHCNQFCKSLNSSVIRQNARSPKQCYKKICVCVSGGKKCLLFWKLGVLCFLATPILRLAVLPYCQLIICAGDNKINCDQNNAHHAVLISLQLTLNMYFMNGSHLILSLRVFRQDFCFILSIVSCLPPEKQSFVSSVYFNLSKNLFSTVTLNSKSYLS